MSKPIYGDDVAKMVADPRLIQAYNLALQADAYLDDFRSDMPRGEDVLERLYEDVGGVLPALCQNLSLMVVADINRKFQQP